MGAYRVSAPICFKVRGLKKIVFLYIKNEVSEKETSLRMRQSLMNTDFSNVWKQIPFQLGLFPQLSN